MLLVWNSRRRPVGGSEAAAVAVAVEFSFAVAVELLVTVAVEVRGFLVLVK